MAEDEFLLCMQGMAAGDKSGLKRIYEAYLKLIYSVCYSMLKHKEAAEDVTSDFFIRLYKNATTFDGRGAHKTWLVTIAKNMCIDYIRKNSREMAILDAEDDEGMQHDVPDEKSSFESGVENKLVLREAVKQLTEQQQQVISMKTAGGMTFKEISEALGMPQGTVSWHYNEAIKKLRRILS